MFLLTTAGFAWNTQGLVNCNGLFVLDQKDRKFRTMGCIVEDSTHVKNWDVQAGYGNFDLDARWKYIGINEFYTWTVNFKKHMDLGYASVRADYRHLNFRLDVSSLPYYVASTNWYTLDSVLFAGASYGRGELDLLDIKWVSASKLSIIPKIEGKFKDKFHFSRFSAGSRTDEHTINVGYTLGATDPDVSRKGYVFSDSSRFWEIEPSYTYQKGPNEFSLLYSYLNADLNFFGLLREGKSEKRFFFLPVGVDMNLLKADFRHSTGETPERTSAFSARAILMELELALIYDDRRFYETLAPNRGLTSSIIKTLSFSVYNRSFRLYGDADVKLADAGAGYEWDKGIGSWRIKPSFFVDMFYTHAEADLRKRTETTNALYAEHFTDTLSWDVSVVGAVASAGVSLESGRRFFTKLDVSQIVPFYFSKEQYPPENAPAPPPEGQPSTEPSGPVTSEESDNVSNVNRFFKLFRNGFAINAQIGVKF